MSFVDIREPRTNWLLARFDPERDILEIQRRGVKTTVDLAQYRPQLQRELVDKVWQALGNLRPDAGSNRGE